MGRFDGVVDVDDERIAGFSLDARKMIVADQLQKQQAPSAEAVTVAQQWSDHIEERIQQHVDLVIDVVASECAELYGTRIDQLIEEVQLLKQRVFQEDQKQKVTIIAPGLDIAESVKKECNFFFAGLGNDIREIRDALNLRRAGELTSAEVFDWSEIRKRG